MTTLDPLRKEPSYLSFMLLIRAARRWRRLVELDAPSIIVDQDVKNMFRHAAAMMTAGWTSASSEVRRSTWRRLSGEAKALKR